MRIFGYYWGIGGVLVLLLSAIFRLSPRILEMFSYPLSPAQWIGLIAFAAYMIYAEGYRGFHCNFSPRVIVRALVFRQQAGSYRIAHVLLAPLVCMGYLYATPKRRIVSLSVTGAIICLVIIVSRLPQPWRGIIDTGVVLGLILGVASIAYYWALSLKGEWQSPVPADFPI